MQLEKSFLNSTKVEQALNALRTTPGSSELDLRQTIEQYATSLTLGEAPPNDIPQDLQPYIDKIVLHAYKITDRDVQHLKDVGYSEDFIYEVTLCASVATSLARIEQGLKPLG